MQSAYSKSKFWFSKNTIYTSFQQFPLRIHSVCVSRCAFHDYPRPCNTPLSSLSSVSVTEVGGLSLVALSIHLEEAVQGQNDLKYCANLKMCRLLLVTGTKMDEVQNDRRKLENKCRPWHNNFIDSRMRERQNWFWTRCMIFHRQWRSRSSRKNTASK